MAEKAVITSTYGVDLDGEANEYVITVNCAVTDGQGGHIVMNAEARSANFRPPLLQQSWKTRIRNAVIAKASNDYSLTVDDVMFPDEWDSLGL